MRVSLLLSVLLAAVLSATACFAQDLESDTWVATDALGRHLPTYVDVGGPRAGKYVGIFYFLWLGQHGTGGPYDITEIVKQPDPKPWGPVGAFHHWGQAELGYYLSTDQYVLRKHCQMLVDAGVDALIFDVTNNFTYKDSYMALCSVFQDIRNSGGKTPQIAFLCPFWSPAQVVQTLYSDLYSLNLYPDVWYKWDGKPLILADSNLVDAQYRSFFTFRKPMPDYFAGPSGSNQWGWLEVYPQHSFYDTSGACEEVTVGASQNATDISLSQMSVQTGIHGRSWHNGSKDMAADAVDHGYDLQEQWNRALTLDPKFVFLTGWNEWVAQRGEGNVFWDAYNQEYSRDIEPMKGGHTDNYYFQMIANLRKYKGVRQPTGPSAAKTITIDGSFADWDDVAPEYKDYSGDAFQRTSTLWGSAGTVVNNTGRNDFTKMKVARDSSYIYFYVETVNPITTYTGTNWMMLFIDSDCNYDTGWKGYDYIINYPVTGHPLTSVTTPIIRHTGWWNWNYVGSADYRLSGNKMEIRVPRSLIGQSGSNVAFDFHWADSIQKTNDIIEFSVSGDSAPNRRFNYRYAAITPGPQWEFADNGNMEGWNNPTHIANLRASGGCLSGDISTGDPYVGGPRYPDVDASANHYVHVRMKITTGSYASLYWGSQAQPYHSESRVLSFPIVADGQFHDYVIDMTASPTWTGSVNSLRLDPSGDSSSGHFDVDCIRILKDAPVFIPPDTTAPAGTTQINSGATYTNSRSVTLTLSATDAGSGVSQMRFSNDNSGWSAWEPYAASKAWTIASGDGTQYVYAQFKDAADNTSASCIGSILLDTTPPIGSISVNSNSAYTASNLVTLNLAASDTGAGVNQGRLSNDNMAWGGWYTFAATRQWSLGSGYGAKTVYAQFRDKAGNASQSCKASIYLVRIGGVGIDAVKGLADSDSAGVAAKVVTAVFGDKFYIEETDRSTGLMVKPIYGLPTGLNIGSVVDVGGSVMTGLSGERWLDGIAVIRS